MTDAIRTELLSDASVERFKAKLLKRLHRASVDTGRIRKLEGEGANMVESIAQGMRSAALLARLQETEGELERLKAAARVVDVKAIMAAIPVAVANYRKWAAGLGTAPIDIEQGREIIREMASHIPVRPGADGVPVAELALNEAMPLGLAAGSDIGVVAGA